MTTISDIHADDKWKATHELECKLNHNKIQQFHGLNLLLCMAAIYVITFSQMVVLSRNFQTFPKIYSPVKI